MDLQTGRSAASAAPTHPLEWLRRSWLEAAAEVAPGDPSLGELLDARLAALGSRGDTGEAALLLVVEDAAHHALGQGSTELARQVSRRLRRSVYEFLLAVDAAAEVAPGGGEEAATTEGSSAALDEGSQPGSVLIGIEEVVAAGRRRPRLMWDDAELVGATMDPVADDEDDAAAPPRLTVLGPDAETGSADAAPADEASRVPERFRRDETPAATPIVVPSYLAWADVLAGDDAIEEDGVAEANSGTDPGASSGSDPAEVELGAAQPDDADGVAVATAEAVPVEAVADEAAIVEAPVVEVQTLESPSTEDEADVAPDEAEVLPEAGDAPPEDTVASDSSDVVAEDDSPDWENLEEWVGLPVTTIDAEPDPADAVSSAADPDDEAPALAAVDADDAGEAEPVDDGASEGAVASHSELEPSEPEPEPEPEPDLPLASTEAHEVAQAVDATEPPWDDLASAEEPVNADARAAVEAALFEALSAERLAEQPRPAAQHHQPPDTAPEEADLWPMPSAPVAPPEWLPSTVPAPAPALDAWPGAPAPAGASIDRSPGAEPSHVDADADADADAVAGGWSVRQSPRQQQLAERMARKRREEAVRAAIDAFEPGPIESERRRRKRGAQERLHRTSLPSEVEELLGRRKGADAGALLQRAAQELGGREVADLAVDAGDRCRAIGQGRAAINCFLAAWRSDPLYETPLWRLADTCIADRSIDLAVGYLERVCDLVIARGDEEGANAVLRKIVAIAPERTDIRRLLLDRTAG